MESHAGIPPIPQPVACSLNHAELDQRLREWQALRAAALLSERTVDGVVTTAYRRSPDVLQRLRSLIEAERRCCAFLRFDLREEGEVIRVAITFPPGIAD